MDLVIPLGSGSEHDDLELKYLLRSAEEHFENLTNVVVVGKRPSWFVNGLHLPASDPFKTNNKDANIIVKLRDAITCPKVSKPFVWSADDGFFLQPWTLIDQLVPEARLWSKEENKTTASFQGINQWDKRKSATWEYLCGRLGFEPLYYDMHGPQPLAEDYEDIVESAPYAESPGLLVTSLYMNLSKAHPKPARGRVRRPIIRRPLSDAELDKTAETYKFATCSASGFSAGTRAWLERRYNRKSQYERS